MVQAAPSDTWSSFYLRQDVGDVEVAVPLIYETVEGELKRAAGPCQMRSPPQEWDRNPPSWKGATGRRPAEPVARPNGHRYLECMRYYGTPL